MAISFVRTEGLAIALFRKNGAENGLGIINGIALLVSLTGFGLFDLEEFDSSVFDFGDGDGWSPTMMDGVQINHSGLGVLLSSSPDVCSVFRRFTLKSNGDSLLDGVVVVSFPWRKKKYYF